MAKLTPTWVRAPMKGTRARPCFYRACSYSHFPFSLSNLSLDQRSLPPPFSYTVHSFCGAPNVDMTALVNSRACAWSTWT
ncbi:hypothetical protein B0F90DRAFT_1755450 [Multifurca ochricompacta]|uniref:Uncharacterized protein n=1 Tax=Multifurca ochricompacta TaxID=376703 RepID=A0AAD4M098_9AGAM|nr:hypothetical protein B0F90DRAFT_1755450 [Multifurca ochricompacta]